MQEGPDFIVPQWLCFTLLSSLRYYVRDKPASGAHGQTIGGEEAPYLRRWFLTPRGEGPAAYLHQFLRDDDDRALHDHPYASLGIILSTGYLEHTPQGVIPRRVGDVIHRQAEDRHRIVLHRDAAGRPAEAWTLFLVGRRFRNWGFWCAGERFVPWQDFTTGPNGERVGRGCD